MQTGSVKLSNFQRIVWCAVPYAVRASVWSWWPALRTNAQWRLSAYSGVFMWLIFVHVYVRDLFNAWKKLQEWVSHTKTKEKKFVSMYVRKHVDFKVQPNNALTHIHRISVLYVFICWDSNPLVYSAPIENEETLHNRIFGACKTIHNRHRICERLWQSVMRRVYACGNLGGECSERLLWILIWWTIRTQQTLDWERRML